MLIEELNLIPSEDNYLKVISSCRSSIPELKPQVFSNFNPSDAGFAWIKKRFNIKGIPTQPIFTKDEKTGLMRVFIPARLSDNPYLNADPQYRAFLNGLPDGLREAWRDGSWMTQSSKVPSTLPSYSRCVTKAASSSSHLILS